MSEHTTLARRHLLTALGIGTAALLSKAALAQPGPPSNDDLYWPPLQQIPGWYYQWGLPADEIGHYQGFYGTPYPQSLFNNLIGSIGPPPKGILDTLNANPAQAGSPLGIPPGTYTFNYPGYSPSGPGIEDNSTYWPPLQQIPPWYFQWQFQANEIGHYYVAFGTPYAQSLFNNDIANLGPPPEGVLDQINANPVQASAPLGIPAGTYTFDYPGYSPGVVFCVAHRSGWPMVNGQSKT
jgi:hypothetical protein